MFGLMIVAVWFAFVAVYLVRQWWGSELAVASAGVDAPHPATLPTAPEGIAAARRRVGAFRVAGTAAR